MDNGLSNQILEEVIAVVNVLVHSSHQHLTNADAYVAANLFANVDNGLSSQILEKVIAVVNVFQDHQ